MPTPADHATAARAFTPTDLTPTASFIVAGVHALLATKTGSGADYVTADGYLTQAEALGENSFNARERLAHRARIYAQLAS